MHRIKLPERAKTSSAMETPHYQSLRDYWWEGVGYEITSQQAATLQASIEEAIERYTEAMNEVTNNETLLRRFNYTKDRTYDRIIQDFAAVSWKGEQEKTHILDRWDVAWDGVNALEVLERNTGYMGLVVGTGIVQTQYIDWLRSHPGYEDVRSLGDFQMSFAQAFNKAAQERGLRSDAEIILTVPEDAETVDREIILTGPTLKSWIEFAGFKAHLLPARHVDYSEGQFLVIQTDKSNGIISDADIDLDEISNREIIEWMEHFPQDGEKKYHTRTIALSGPKDGLAIFPFYGYDEYLYARAKAHTGISIGVNGPVVLEPAWSHLMHHKAMLPIIHKLFPNHPNFPPAFFGLPTKQVYVDLAAEQLFAKPDRAFQGLGAKIFDGSGKLIAQRTDNFDIWNPTDESDNYITQRYCRSVDNPDGSRKVVHVFTSSGKIAGAGVREAPGPFVGGDDTNTRLLPLIVKDKPSTQNSFYSCRTDKFVGWDDGLPRRRRIAVQSFGGVTVKI